MREQRVVIDQPVRIEQDSPAYENPLLTLLGGAILGALGSWLIARNERNHADTTRRNELAAARGEAKARARMERFDRELRLGQQREQGQRDTVRSLSVLKQLLGASALPDRAIATLRLCPEAFDEAETSEQVEAVAQLLATYGAAAETDHPTIRGQLATAVVAVLPATELTADATTDTMRLLRTTGAKSAQDEADLLIPA